MITKKYYKLVRVSYADSGYLYIKNVSNSSGVFSVTRTGSPVSNPDIEYSTDGVTWTAYNFTNLPTIEVPAGNSMYLRGTNPNGLTTSSGNSYYNFNFNTDFVVGGNFWSILDKTNYASVTSLPSLGYFKSLFEGNTTLLDAGDMNFGNVTTLRMVSGLFGGCTSLTTPPDMSSVTTIDAAGCRYMFWGCTSLTTAPDLSSVTSIGNYGCEYMFQNCTSLTTPPDLSSLTSINMYGCQYMFYGCTSLATAPDMSSVTSIENYGCPGMFNGCTSLTTAPDLSSVTVIKTNSYGSMFHNCTSLTTAPDLSSVTSVESGGCNQMYYMCQKLSSVTTPNIDTWDTSKFNNWLYNTGTSATGTKTVYKPAALTVPTNSTSGVPTGWTVENYA